MFLIGGSSNASELPLSRSISAPSPEIPTMSSAQFTKLSSEIIQPSSQKDSAIKVPLSQEERLAILGAAADACVRAQKAHHVRHHSTHD